MVHDGRPPQSTGTYSYSGPALRYFKDRECPAADLKKMGGSPKSYRKNGSYQKYGQPSLDYYCTGHLTEYLASFVLTHCDAEPGQEWFRCDNCGGRWGYADDPNPSYGMLMYISADRSEEATYRTKRLEEV